MDAKGRLTVERSIVTLGQKKHNALVAHDNKKQDLLEWAKERQGPNVPRHKRNN